MNLRSRLLSALSGLSMLFVCGSLIPVHHDTESPLATTPADLKYLAPGFDIRTIRPMPGRITSLLVKLDPDSLGESLYIGTAGAGGIYRLYAGRNGFLLGTRAIATALGDDMEYCACEVNRIAIRDLDHDGMDELIAETSQIAPRGRPRIYVWSQQPSLVLRAFVRPSIESSWVHGMSFVRHDDNDSIVSTYCGYGEIVEYRLNSATAVDGFQDESIGWRVIGQLPTSGEGIDVTDVDNDEVADVCVATGYSENKAAIHVYDSIEAGLLENPKITIDEEQRYGTVKFLVGTINPDGPRELFVWWCAGLGDGHTDFIRYRLGSNGVEFREHIASGSSAEIWPIDGQMTIADLDGDGNGEVWFATASGNLYRYTPGDHSGLFLACEVSGGFGPIVAGEAYDRPRLYLGSKSTVLQFNPIADKQ